MNSALRQQSGDSSSSHHATPTSRVLKYQQGFGRDFESEAVPGALPSRNNPLHPPLGLYGELVTTSYCMAPRQFNQRAYVYRLRPSVGRGQVRRVDLPYLRSAPLASSAAPFRLRWSHVERLAESPDFVSGLRTICANGDVALQAGVAFHTYSADRDMDDRYFVCNDGEFLIVPQSGSIRAHTEMGILDVAPGEVLLIPRGVTFRIKLEAGPSTGFVCENYGPPFRLPELGPIGSHGLASSKDFLAPIAAFEDRKGPFELIQKYGGGLWSGDLTHSPLDVVAWRGTTTPIKYDMSTFTSIGSVSEDHLDPSIFTAMTSPSDPVLGANVDFLILAPQWVVGENTFRSPPFHRNTASEVSVVIRGANPSKAAGSAPGSMVLHNACAPHGPDVVSFEKTTAREDSAPFKQDSALMVAWETRFPLAVTDYALNTPALEADYAECWSGFLVADYRESPGPNSSIASPEQN